MHRYYLIGAAIAAVLGHWPEHVDPELGRRGGDLQLGYRSLVVRSSHEHMFAHAVDGKAQPSARLGASPQSCSRR